MEFGGELSASDIAKCSLAQQLDRFTNTWITGKGKESGRKGDGKGHWALENTWKALGSSIDHFLEDNSFNRCGTLDQAQWRFDGPSFLSWRRWCTGEALAEAKL